MREEPLDDQPATDVAEQQRPLNDAESDEDDSPRDATTVPWEADAADVAEQRRVVPIPPDDEL